MLLPLMLMSGNRNGGVNANTALMLSMLQPGNSLAANTTGTQSMLPMLALMNMNKK